LRYNKGEVKVMIQLKRAYDQPDATDGYRILVDRLWPRGKTKEFEALDEWCKTVAPSSALRKWFNHGPEKFNQFKIQYQQELQQEPAKQAVAHLRSILAQHKTVTLVYGAKDPRYNHARVLKEWLENHA
jgi:uncharacterized protein YeaO (DUF488 family)